ncbi:hypothetical protein ACFQ60_45715 [Streptomyces zhihengii]
MLRAWRPLASLPCGDGRTLTIDDADPFRDCFPAAVTPPLDPGPLDAFRDRLATAYGLLDEREPGWRDGANASTATTLTPLAAGSGLHLGTCGSGALGVAIDVEPEDFARELPRLGRRARLTALREVVDLHLPGSPAERLLDLASEHIGAAARSSPDAAPPASWPAACWASCPACRHANSPRTAPTWPRSCARNGRPCVTDGTRLVRFLRGLGVRPAGVLLAHASSAAPDCRPAWCATPCCGSSARPAPSSPRPSPRRTPTPPTATTPSPRA